MVYHSRRKTHLTKRKCDLSTYVTNPMITSIGIYLFHSLLLITKVSFFFFQICPDGTIRFDEPFVLNFVPVPTWNIERFPFNIAMFFPFWSVIDRDHSFCSSAQDCIVHYSNRSAVFYQVYTEGSNAPNASYILDRASQDVKNNTQEFGFFSASWVLVVTWLRLRPKVKSREDVKEDIVSPLKMQQMSSFFRGKGGFGVVFPFDLVRPMCSTK